MKSKKLSIISWIFLSLAFNSCPLAFGDKDSRVQGLVWLGLILGVGGTYQLVKKSEKASKSLLDIVGGTLLCTLGAISIGLSEQIIREIDGCFK